MNAIMPTVRRVERLVTFLERLPEPDPDARDAAYRAVCLIKLGTFLPIPDATPEEEADQREALAALEALEVRVEALGMPDVTA